MPIACFERDFFSLWRAYCVTEDNKVKVLFTYDFHRLVA